MCRMAGALSSTESPGEQDQDFGLDALSYCQDCQTMMLEVA